MTKNKGGRPTKFTPETIAKLEEAFLLGCTDVEACFWAEVSKTALYNYQEKNPEFVDRKERLKSNPFLIARKAIKDAIEAGDAKTAMDFMKNRKSDEFSTRGEITGADGGPINTSIQIEFVDSGED